MINEIKAKIQAEAGQALRDNHGGIVAIATGGGKSKIAIDFSRDMQRNKKDLKILLVVPTRTLRDTDWRDEFTKWGATELWSNNVRKECYAYISKIKGEQFDLVILDELQHITPNNFELFRNNNIGTIIGLSATPPKEKEKQDLLESIELGIVYEVKLDDAVDLGLVAPYKLVLIETNLNKIVSYIETGGKNRKWMTTEQRQYDWMTSDIAKHMAIGTPSYKMKFKYLNRMRLIYNLRSKETIAKYILEKLISKEDRTLIFCGSINMAEALESHTYHSKTSEADLEKFRDEEINRLSSVQALNEGVNIANVDNAFIVQVNSNERNLIQKMGRVLRHRDGHTGTIYIMYVKGTVDEKWALSAMENLNRNDIIRMRMTT